MNKLEKIKHSLTNGDFNKTFEKLYCTKEFSKNIERYLNILNGYEKAFGNSDEIRLFSAPGRTEIGGNHTDHQNGCVIAASINLDVIAAVSINNENIIRVQSEGYPLDEIDLNDLTPKQEEYNQAKALIKGVAARFKELGFDVKGFNAYTSSNVLKGSGLSSSAAFEVLIGTIINSLFCENKISAVEIAQISQYAENVFFGKPCGLMDQMASSVGNIVSIDFKDTKNPVIKKVNFDFASSGYALCIIDSGADHADLTGEYAAIPEEMKKIASYFNKNVLREVSKNDFIKVIPNLRQQYGDRSVLRALHFFNDNKKAIEEAECLEAKDFDKFLKLVKESGQSSYMYLQNVCVCGSAKEQAVGIVLAFCDEFLQGKGAFRVHGGGFAGTVQAFVPLESLQKFKNNIENITGKDSCHILSIRPFGGVEVSQFID